MESNPSEFKRQLIKAIVQIHASQAGKSKLAIRDELGYAVGRLGRTAVDYWCRGRGHIPDLTTVETLAREMVRLKGFIEQRDLEKFLSSAGHQHYQDFARTLMNPNVEQKMPASAHIPYRGSSSGNLRGHRLGGLGDLRAKQIVILALFAAIALFLLFAESRRMILLAQEHHATPTVQPYALSMVASNGQWISVTVSGQNIHSGESIPAWSPVTVAFKVVNNDYRPVKLKVLVIGSKGPGISCEDTTKMKWAALDNPFPTLENVTLQPGEAIEYHESRTFYLPGNYFLEPVMQDEASQWNGIQPFSCINIRVR